MSIIDEYQGRIGSSEKALSKLKVLEISEFDSKWIYVVWSKALDT